MMNLNKMPEGTRFEIVCKIDEVSDQIDLLVDKLADIAEEESNVRKSIYVFEKKCSKLERKLVSKEMI